MHKQHRHRPTQTTKYAMNFICKEKMYFISSFYCALLINSLEINNFLNLRVALHFYFSSCSVNNSVTSHSIQQVREVNSTSERRTLVFLLISKLAASRDSQQIS